MHHLDIVVICINRILHYLSQSYIRILISIYTTPDPYTIEPEQESKKRTRGILQTNASGMDRPWNTIL